MDLLQFWCYYRAIRSIYEFGEKMNEEKIISALRQSPLFAILKTEDLEKIAKKAKVRQFFAEDVIVWQGQPSTTLFLIINGIVAVKRVVREQESVLAYLMPGNSFGEMGILENQPRSASVAALSEVDVLVIRREDFLSILHEHPVVAIELAKALGRYLVQANRRMSNDTSQTRLILLLNTEENAGGTSFGTLLAERLVESQGAATVYMEYPNPWRALNGYQLNKGATVYHHGEGYDILLPQPEPYLPKTTRMTLLMDKIKGTYENIVIKIQGELDEATDMLLEDANQVIIMAPPTKEGIKDLEFFQKQLKGKVRIEETSVLTLINRHKPEHQELAIKEFHDFELPYIPNFPMFQIPERLQVSIPKELDEAIDNAIERLERTNSIGIFIPTTVEVDQTVDTAHYRKKAMDFMAERFGGATCKEANGVWHSEQVGLVGEVIYIVHSYITRSDLNRYLDEVVDFMKSLKQELKQEAMALEVNNKMTLI